MQRLKIAIGLNAKRSHSRGLMALGGEQLAQETGRRCFAIGAGNAANMRRLKLKKPRRHMSQIAMRIIAGNKSHIAMQGLRQ